MDAPSKIQDADVVAIGSGAGGLILDAVNRFVPGIRDALVFSELGTPLTNVHYCEATRGSLYGIEKRRMQVGPFGFPIQTEIDGLVHCGASTVGHGVMEATWSGILAASRLVGERPSTWMRGQGAGLRTVPCDHPEHWPADLQARLKQT